MNVRANVAVWLLFLVFLLSSGTALGWESMPGKAGVTAFACSDDEQKMVVGTYYGGVWFSLNGGVTWYPSDTGENRVNFVNSIVAIDSEADTLVMNCGFSTYPNFQTIRKKNLISTNNGQSWYFATENADFDYDQLLTVDPQDHTNIYCTVNGDFAKSENFGETWSDRIDAFGSYYNTCIHLTKDTHSTTMLLASGTLLSGP